MRLYKTAILSAVFSCLIFPVFAIGVIDPPSYFEVLPNKTYSSGVCFSDLEENKGIIGEVTLTNKSGLIAEFTYDELEPYRYHRDTIFIDEKRDIQCTTLHIKIADYKTSNEELITETLVYKKKFGNINLGVSHEITFDASEVNYINALLKFSKKLVLTIFSIFVMLTVLLYMIRKIRKE